MLPITPCILKKKLIAFLPHTVSSHIVPVFMKSMFLLAFHCFFKDWRMYSFKRQKLSSTYSTICAMFKQYIRLSNRVSIDYENFQTK